VTAFYKRHNPAEMEKVEKAMTMNVTEEQLFTKLASLYPSQSSTDRAV
jgi:hypothetical protein